MTIILMPLNNIQQRQRIQMQYGKKLTGLYCREETYAYTAPSMSPAATSAAARLM